MEEQKVDREEIKMASSGSVKFPQVAELAQSQADEVVCMCSLRWLS